MFYVIGLGLGDCKDVTVKGLEIIKNCDRVYLEAYTSILTCGTEALTLSPCYLADYVSGSFKELKNTLQACSTNIFKNIGGREEFYGRKLIVADRDLVEQGTDDILRDAATSEVALLVVGDPFGATTHTDLVLRAKEKGIPFRIVHNASILNAVGCCGLQLYSFGETVSIPYWTDSWKPDSFFDRIVTNYNNKLHTLCLLDIKVKEPTLESLTKKKKEYMPPKFMSVSEAAGQLLEIAQAKNEVINEESLCIGLARVGSETQQIVACSLGKMAKFDLGGPLHSLIVAGPALHPLEEEFLRQFRV